MKITQAKQLQVLISLKDSFVEMSKIANKLRLLCALSDDTNSLDGIYKLKLEMKNLLSLNKLSNYETIQMHV